VWFRDSCRERARAAGVAGWVRNRGDGAVEGEFEGSASAVDEVVTWCKTGPPRARVDNVEVTTIPATGEQNFHVR
jgi:acylphosphatase